MIPFQVSMFENPYEDFGATIIRHSPLTNVGNNNNKKKKLATSIPDWNDESNTFFNCKNGPVVNKFGM